MTPEVETAGRTDVDEFFRLSGIRETKRLNHHPLLIFMVTGATVRVVIESDPRRLLEYPADTRVMAQWGGQWRSDFFQFTVGQFRDYVSANPPQKHHVV
jgi:hypothetical protein